MKHCVVPRPIFLHNALTEKDEAEPWPFRKHWLLVWANEEVWATPRSNLARLVRVDRECSKPEGEAMTFEDDDYAILRKIVETPHPELRGKLVTCPPMVQVQLRAYDEAILSATDGPAQPVAAKVE
jgi:hypothetical protein